MGPDETCAERSANTKDTPEVQEEEVDIAPEAERAAGEAAKADAAPAEPSVDEGKEPREADFPPIDPAAGSETVAAEGPNVDIVVRWIPSLVLEIEKLTAHRKPRSLQRRQHPKRWQRLKKR